MSEALGSLLDRYPHYETVQTTDGEVIELRTCPRCGVVVRGITVELHESWHAAIGGPVFDVQACRVCGCTDDDCSQCIEITGQPCAWAEPDLCTACASGPVQ